LCATFGTAFGGVLFSIEVTSTAFMIRNLPRSFLTAIAAASVFLALGIAESWSLFGGTEVKPVKYKGREMLLFLGFGVLCGLVGVVFNLLTQSISVFRNDVLRNSLPQQVVARRRYLLILCVTLIVAPVKTDDAAAVAKVALASR
jgi:chloride channel 2